MSGTEATATTVLLPVYFADATAEHLRFLQRALESVHVQEFPGPYEVLIVDDGSPTPVESHAAAFGPDLTRHVRFVRQARNGGLVHALNTGLMQSRHPFIARIDADDRWLPTKIAKQFAQFAQDPDLTVSATGMTLVDEAGKPIEPHVRPGDWKGILKFFTDVGCPFPHGSVLARREIYHLVGGYPHDPAVSHCEDYALWGVWLRFFKPAMVEEALYDYTVSASSVSEQNKIQQLTASEAISAAFLALNAPERVPVALRQLAEALGVTQLEAGIVAYRAWRYRLGLMVPPDAIAPLRQLMPDRIVKAASTAGRQGLTLDQLLPRPVAVKLQSLVQATVA
jgi:glycosyltransferase involved in cell wall biosynthesis